MGTVEAPAQTRPVIRHIDETRLETDVPYRVAYLSEFMGITPADWAAIHESGTILAPVVKNLVDAVYQRLFSYDCTKRHF